MLTFVRTDTLKAIGSSGILTALVTVIQKTICNTGTHYKLQVLLVY